MLTDKKVQEIIVDCLFKLEPILCHELTALKSPEFKKNLALKKKESRLHVLAKDVKKLMTNFETIKMNIGSLSERVDDFSTHLDQKPLINYPGLKTLESPLVQFLSSLSSAKLISNQEFEDFPREAWNKHMEVEKMLEAELYLYRIRWNSMEYNNYCRLSHVKQKAGLKIQRLEQEINEKKFHFIHRLAQVGMQLEERLGLETRRADFEKQLLKEEENSVFVPDLLTAVEKIKSLLTVRQILEFSRHQDDKIIQVLNDKIQTIAFDFTETQEKLKDYLKFVKILGNSLVFIFQNVDWNREEQDRLIRGVKKMDFDDLEGKVKTLFMNRSLNDRENNEKHLAESPKKEKNQGKRKSPRTKLKIVTSPLHSPGKEPEGSLSSVRKVMNILDTELKNRNKKLNENISEIVSTLTQPQKPRLKEISIKTKLAEPRHELKKITKEESVQTVTTFKLMKIKETSVQTIPKNFSSQLTETDVSHLDIQALENCLKNRDVVRDYQEYMQEKMFTQETQTEKRVVHKEFSDSRALARGIMRKYTVPTTSRSVLNSTRLTPNDISRASSNLFKSIETGVPITPNEAVEEDIKEAADEYSKEFGIFSQFLGYKKLDFYQIQKLWEEVINRRLSEGEKDKITLYLKEYEGSSNYEVEKLKIIHMLMMIKKQKVKDSAFDNLVRGFKKKMNVLNRWRKFLIVFIQKNVKKILTDSKEGKTIDLYSMSIFLKIINKNMTVLLEKKHLMKKSETSVIFKDEAWTNTSKSPTLMKKTIVKSRLFNTKHNKTYEKILRIKSPADFRSFRDIGKLPIIANILPSPSK